MDIIKSNMTCGELLLRGMDNEKLSIRKAEVMIVKANFHLAFYYLRKIIKFIIGIFIFFGILVLSVILSPFWFMQEIAKTSWMMTVFLSVAIGVYTGTFWRPLLGYPLWGFITGISTILISVALHKHIPKLNYYLIWENTLGKFIKSNFMATESNFAVIGQ